MGLSPLILSPFDFGKQLGIARPAVVGLLPLIVTHALDLQPTSSLKEFPADPSRFLKTSTVLRILIPTLHLMIYFHVYVRRTSNT